MIPQKVASLEELWRETEKAQQDSVLIQLVRESTSPEDADRTAEQSDYPTYLCRQARLLAQIRAHDRDAWDARVPSQVISTWPRRHEYPCEWEVEHYHGRILSTHAGTLVVTKSLFNAAVLWDYTLLDEDGAEVCHSCDLNRDWYLREGLLSVNCHLNSGSRLLPRNGLTICFSSVANSLYFKRTKDESTVWWTRLAHRENDQLQPYISRRIYGTRQQEHHEVVMKPLSPAEAQAFSTRYHPYAPQDSWGLFLEKSFLRDADGESDAFVWYITAGYVFSGKGFLMHLQDTYPRKNLQAEKIILMKTGTYQHYSMFNIAANMIRRDDRSRYDESYQPSDKSVEAIMSCIIQEMPPTIDIVATITQLCNLLKMDDYIYHKDKEKESRVINLLISA